jgi:hypothetical protein
MMRINTTKNQGVATNKRWEISTPVPTEKPYNKPLPTATELILLNASITRTNNKGESGSSCLRPQEMLKNPLDEPFSKTECHTEEMQ